MAAATRAGHPVVVYSANEVTLPRQSGCTTAFRYTLLASLDRSRDAAAAVVRALGVSVADAHLASVLTTAPGPHAVMTSDEADVRRIAAHLGGTVTVVVV